MYKQLAILGLVVTNLSSCSSQKDSAVHWTGEGDGTSWSDEANWNPAGVPIGQTVVIGNALISVDIDVSIGNTQRVVMADAVLRIADGATLVNAGVIEFRNSAVAEDPGGTFTNDGAVLGSGVVSMSCGGGAAPNTGDVSASVDVVICAAPCDPADECCGSGGPTGCTHTAKYWRHEPDWPLAKDELLCNRGFAEILRSDDFGDLESDSGSDSDPCSDSSESASSSSESASSDSGGEPSDPDEESSDSGSISSDSDSLSQGDLEEAWFQLAHSYIAAVLNQADGASSTPRVDLALAETLALLESNCDGLPAAMLNTIRELDLVLRDYNAGVTGPGPCPDDPVECPADDDDGFAMPAMPKTACFDTGFGEKCVVTRGITTQAAR